jgi:hypothetical protein
MRVGVWVAFVVVGVGAAAVGTVMLPALPVADPADIPLRRPIAGFQNKVVLSVRGTLTEHDPLDRVRFDSHHRVHLVRLSADRRYLIDLKSQEFDAYLRVEDAAGTHLAEADDNGVNLDARLPFQPPHDGTYRIIVTTFEMGETGSYHLLIRE